MADLPIPGDPDMPHIQSALLYDLSLHQGRANFRRTCLSCEASSSSSFMWCCGSALPWKHQAARAGLLAPSPPWHLLRGPQQASYIAWNRQEEDIVLGPSLPHLQGIVLETVPQQNSKL